MGRTRQNLLQIAALPGGSFRLSGYFDGNKIRVQSRNLSALQKKKSELDANLVELRAGPQLRSTWLTDEKLRLYEAADLAAKTKGVDVLKLIHDAQGDQLKPVKWDDAIDVWSQFLLNELKRFPRTVKKNRDRLLAFRRGLAGQYVHETSQAEFERHILRAGITARTQLTDGAVIRAFFNFATRPSKRWAIISPVSAEVMIDLQGRAPRAGKRPRILSPEEASRLLVAAYELKGGAHVPYVVLSTWCFLRHAEVLRVEPADLVLTKGSARLVVVPRKRGTVSERVVTIPENARGILEDCFKTGALEKGKRIYFQQFAFDEVRERAGLIVREKEPTTRGYLKIISSTWQENVLRHTGISYLYQKTGDIREVCRQAGNSSSTAFKHYLHIPAVGAAKTFYAASIDF